MTPAKRYCTACGAPGNESSLFCEKCGRRFPVAGTGSGPIQSTAAPTQPAPGIRSGWNVFVGDRLPPLPAGAAAALAPMPAPAGTYAPFRSLRGSVFGLFSAAAIEIAAAIASGTPPTQKLLLIRGGAAVITLLAGLVAGRKRGLAAIFVALGTVGLSMLEGHLLWQSVSGMLRASSIMPNLLPPTVTQGLAVLAGLQTILQMRR